jgi:hypothetical protein
MSAVISSIYRAYCYARLLEMRRHRTLELTLDELDAASGGSLMQTPATNPTGESRERQLEPGTLTVPN